MLVSQILKTKSDDGVVTVPPGTLVAKVAEMLSARRIGAIVVSVDGKTMLGIVSERDVVRELGLRGAACLADPVESIMTSRVVSCARGDPTTEVMQKMTDGRFRHMPVLEGDLMVGLVSIGDVVKARLSELSMEKEALEGIIKGF